jgi:hypothetical protein
MSNQFKVLNTRAGENGGKIISSFVDKKSQVGAMVEASTDGFIRLEDLTRSDANGMAYGKDSFQNLGVIRQFSQLMGTSESSILQVPINSGAVIEVETGGGFKWQEQVRNHNCLQVVAVDCGDSQELGKYGSTFGITLNKAVRPGDILKNDLLYGKQFMIDLYAEVVHNSDGSYTATARLTDDTAQDDYISSVDLFPGAPLEVIGNFKNQMGTNAGGIMGYEDVSEITRKYILGDRQVIDISLTNDAALNLRNNPLFKDEQFTRRYNYWKDKYGIVTFQGADGRTMGNVAIDGIHLALGAEALKRSALSFMYNDGVLVKGTDGVVRANKGIWNQAREGGYILKYNNKASLRQRLMDASNYIYGRGSAIPAQDRVLDLRVGSNIMYLIRETFSDEFKKSNPMVLNPDAFPDAILTRDGKPYHYEYHGFVITAAFLSGIGMVRLTHDPALDAVTSQNPKFMTQGGLGRGADTAIIWDAQGLYETVIANNSDIKTRIVKDATGTPIYKGGNIFAVKEKDVPALAFGYRDGRSALGGNYSMPEWKHEYFATTNMSGWIADSSRVVIIEKEQF